MSTRRCLCIQIQPDRDPSRSPEEALRVARAVFAGVRVEAAEDGGPYLNLLFVTDTPDALWTELTDRLFGDDALGAWMRSVSIATLEGEQGWDDYRLLWHWDSDEATER